MKMFSYNKIFYPQNIYSDAKFDLIKSNIKNSYSKCEDFGSILAIYCADCIISINSIGKVEFFYGDNTNDIRIYNEVSNIESIFKEHIDNFKILH